MAHIVETHNPKTKGSKLSYSLYTYVEVDFSYYTNKGVPLHSISEAIINCCKKDSVTYTGSEFRIYFLNEEKEYIQNVINLVESKISKLVKDE